jgi:hypothetical protein
MTNKNVIEIINRLMDPDADKVAYNATEVFTAIVHGYYYIRPGKDTVRFIKRINKILTDAHKIAFRNCAETKDGVPFEAWLLGKMSSDMFSVARTMFDREYYTSQTARMVMHEKYDESLLERYMYWLDESELKSVFEGILTFKSSLDIFVSDDNFDKMMVELKECSLNVIKYNPWYRKDYDKHVAYVENNWDFCFEYLSKETIVKVICSFVDIEPVLLAHMIKAFKYADAKTAAEYTGVALWLMGEFEQDIFDPQITDMTTIRLDDYDYRHSKVIHSNKSGKVMLV